MNFIISKQTTFVFISYTAPLSREGIAVFVLCELR